ncbi:MAG: AAA domain-containing protein [Bacteroides sp.]|nr:AAA domain-containing protein [Bacteroides sp.]
MGFERKDGVLKKFCNEAIKSNKLTLSFLKVPDALQLFKEDLKKNGSINISSIKSNTFTTLVKIKLSDNNLISIPNKSGWSVDDATILHYIYGDRVEDYNEYTTLIGEYIKQHYLEKATHNYVTSDKFVFIIDEINRGEISKIFGELFFSIDPGYRGAKDLRVKTQYQNLITDESDPFYEGFYVPDNVYIIGTMNDIDRSVESMDFAMRRRFAWEEVKADENTGMLDNLEDMKDDVVAVMQRLNAAIWDENTNSGIEGLSTAYHIGGAYFSKLALYLNDDHSNKEEAYTHLWNNHLKGLLFEYLRGTPDAMVKLKSLEDRYYNRNGNDTE